MTLCTIAGALADGLLTVACVTAGAAPERELPMADGSYRVIQWATGSIGQIAIRHFVDDPAFELVGVFVTSEARHGKDAGELAGIGHLGIAATTSMADVLALDADVVNYAPLYADLEQMAQILRSEKNVVTPVGFVYPAALDPADVAVLADACLIGGTSLYGAGIHPGFSGDLLPLTCARLCTRIDRIVVQEVADLSAHPSTKMNFEGLGFGRDPDDARTNPSPLIRTMESIFRESMALLAVGLEVPVERTTTQFDVAMARVDIAVRSGKIRKGTVAGMRHEWITWSAGTPAIVFRSFWKMDDDLDPNWGYGSVKYAVMIEGVPSMKLEFEPTSQHPTGDQGYWGRVWTAMNSINAIPAVVAATPGIKTHLDLPLARPPALFRPASGRVW
jgi:2,4-diaminopentanoate dehydrogenase